jgi:hypothetical protein
MPPIDALLDTLGLRPRLEAADTAAVGELIVSVWLEHPPSGFMVEGSAKRSAPKAVLELVLSSVRQASRDAPPVFRVVIEGGLAPKVRLQRSVLCRPELLRDNLSPKAPVAVGRVITATRSGAPPSEPRTVTPKIRIDSTGAVVEVNIGIGSGYREIDHVMSENLLATRYSPARLDGRAVEVWLIGTRVDLVRK